MPIVFFYFQNLMRCSLEVVTAANPIRSWDSEAQGQVALYSKFFRIIELASDFLEVGRAGINSGR